VKNCLQRDGKRAVTLQPIQLELPSPDVLSITWSDGLAQQYPLRVLRENCPCASCREKRQQPPPSPMSLPVLSPRDVEPLRIRNMQPVGHYAYSIEFSDGHNTGIYTLEHLRAIGDPPVET
jgi:DUF971 family protein